MNDEKHGVSCSHDESITIMGVTFCLQCENIAYSDGSRQAVRDAIVNVRRILNSDREGNYSLKNKYTNARETLSQAEIRFAESADTFTSQIGKFCREEIWPYADIDYKGIIHGDDSHQFRDFLQAMEYILEYTKPENDSSI